MLWLQHDRCNARAFLAAYSQIGLSEQFVNAFTTDGNSQYGVTGADSADRGLSCERPKDEQF